MFADTNAIRTFGTTSSAQADDLSVIAAALSTMPGAAADSMLGPVGARFLAALADATSDASRAVATLIDRLQSGHFTARASATAYENADHRLGAAVSRL